MAMSTDVEVVAHAIAPTPEIPNNLQCPLLVYPQVVPEPGADLAAHFEQLFTENGWPGAWRNGIYSFHHYHSTAHEVLGIYRGYVTVQFGGEQGIEVKASIGDVIVVPAGIAHKRVSSRGFLGVVGAYPDGQTPDLCRAGEIDSATAQRRVVSVPLPEQDPVCGGRGPLFEHWNR